MTYFEAAVLGIVEGVTEFLPISSTGHLILTAKLLGLDQTQFVKSFEITIQLGAILAVFLLYWRRILVEFEVTKRVAVAFLPIVVIGLALYKIIKTYLMDDPRIILASLLVGGILIIVFEKFHKEDKDAVSELKNISYKQAFTIGLFQSIAIIPGVSRAAATIIGGLLLGLNRKTIVEFSFLLAIPTMAAATGLDLIKNMALFTKSQMGVLGVGFVVSFIVAILSIKFLLHFIKNNNFMIFGIYRIIVALVFWIFVKG